jgi:hypothetical protein
MNRVKSHSINRTGGYRGEPDADVGRAVPVGLDGGGAFAGNHHVDESPREVGRRDV